VDAELSLSIRKEIEANERNRILEIIAEWANQEGISFDATNRLSEALGLED